VGSDWQPASGRSWVFLVGPLVDRKSRVAAHWDRSSIEQWTRGGGYWLDRPVREEPGYQWPDGGGWATVDFPQRWLEAGKSVEVCWVLGAGCARHAYLGMGSEVHCH
jgi:hypothetical protein